MCVLFRQLKHPDEYSTFFNERILQQLQLIVNEPFKKNMWWPMEYSSHFWPWSSCCSLIQALDDAVLLFISHSFLMVKKQSVVTRYNYHTPASSLRTSCSEPPRLHCFLLVVPGVPRLEYLYPQFIRRDVSVYRVPFFLHFSNKKRHALPYDFLLWSSFVFSTIFFDLNGVNTSIFFTVALFWPLWFSMPHFGPDGALAFRINLY